MGQKYNQLTERQRITMETMLNMGKSKAEVARYLGVHRSTITREYRRGAYVHRNSDYTETERYSSDLGQQKADYNQTAKGKELKIGNDYKLVAFLEHMIGVEKYSPEAALAEISKRKLEFTVTISVKTLYRYIESGLFLNIGMKDLVVKGRKKRKQRKVHRQKRASAGTSIDMRPDEIKARDSFGHWEMDTVKGKLGKTKGALLVLSERKTRDEPVFKMPDQKAKSVVRILDKIERSLGSETFAQVFKSITVDNGVEFSDFEGMEYSKNGTKRTRLFYCHAYSSWERGTNENINKMIRRHIPKGFDFDDISESEIKQIERWINQYPRRIFGFASSEQLFRDELQKRNIEWEDSVL